MANRTASQQAVSVLAEPKRITRAQAPACRRKAERQPFDGKVVIGLSESEGSVGRMRNISPFGCNVQVTAD